MQQKSKFIIFIGLICFVSLIFLPGKVWGVITDNNGGGGGDDCCLKYDYVPYGCYLGVDNDVSSPTYGQNFYFDINHNKIDSCDWECVDWDTTSPGCVDTTTTTQKSKDKWCCNNSTGACYKCSTTGAWSTQAKCEACCPTGTYLHCRPPLTTFWGADADAYYCKSNKWCEVKIENECSDKNAKCIACDTSNGQCYDSSDFQEYTTFPSCETQCVQSVQQPVQQFDFSLSNSGDIVITEPTPGTVVSGSNTITATLISGTTQSVSFSQSGLPAHGVSALPISACSPTCSKTNELTVAYEFVSKVGTYPITVTGAGGSLTRTTTYNLIIKEPTTDTTESPITCYYKICKSTFWTFFTGKLYCKWTSEEVEFGTECPVNKCETDNDCQKTTVTTTTTTTQPSIITTTTTTQPSIITTTTTTTIIPPPPPPPALKCGIIEFSINGRTNEDRDPLYVWVDIFLKGRISTDAYCTKCTVESTDTWGNPNPVEYAMTLLNHYEIEENFKIPETGTYSFTVKCIGDSEDPDDFDEDTVSLQTVEAINLPWWREIIPVLPGFLRGAWR